MTHLTLGVLWAQFWESWKNANPSERLAYALGFAVAYAPTVHGIPVEGEGGG